MRRVVYEANGVRIIVEDASEAPLPSPDPLPTPLRPHIIPSDLAGRVHKLIEAKWFITKPRLVSETAVQAEISEREAAMALEHFVSLKILKSTRTPRGNILLYFQERK